MGQLCVPAGESSLDRGGIALGVLETALDKENPLDILVATLPVHHREVLGDRMERRSRRRNERYQAAR
ncbi:MAG TPA: hypothetical protein VNX26_12085 [Candidatus Acidoferrum sp.]|nr:hypothetical protein [Candidatus Acidoferrum sp.]